MLKDIWARCGLSTTLITRDVAEAGALAERVVVLNEGAVALDAGIGLARPWRELADLRVVDLKCQILEAV
ncbi:MAG: hypothetical protein J7516_18305 [Shinella sp.]|nr:hypothetical protein [Shinella sp.]